MTPHRPARQRGDTYIVTEIKGGGPCHVSTIKDTRGVLFCYRHATGFPTRAHARAAIRHTLRWAAARGYRWREDEYRIVRVVTP